MDECEKVISRESSKKYPIACVIMFRRTAIDEIGMMNEEFLLNEEKEYRERFEKKYNIDHLPIPLYRYRRHKNNITNDSEKLKFYTEKLKKK